MVLDGSVVFYDEIDVDVLFEVVFVILVVIVILVVVISNGCVIGFLDCGVVLGVLYCLVV